MTAFEGDPKEPPSCLRALNQRGPLQASGEPDLQGRRHQDALIQQPPLNYIQIRSSEERRTASKTSPYWS